MNWWHRLIGKPSRGRLPEQIKTPLRPRPSIDIDDETRLLLAELMVIGKREGFLPTNKRLREIGLRLHEKGGPELMAAVGAHAVTICSDFNLRAYGSYLEAAWNGIGKFSA